MDVKWLNAVIDLPAACFERAGDFWVAVTNTTRGEIHPDHPEFVHLYPVSGDMHLELQRIETGPPGVHLDLVVEDISAATAEAVAAGATLVAQPGHSVLRTPGGVAFCVVPYGGEATKAQVIDPARPHAADQLCIDVPHEHFDGDVEFWATLTGWNLNPAELPEYRSLEQPANLPIRVIFQQLGTSDTGGPRAHLDISAGEHHLDLVRLHVALGAAVADSQDSWTTLVDPGGMTYCVTARQPSAR